MKTIGITGYKGRLGRHLLSVYSNFVGLDCDVADLQSVENCVGDIDGILHLAAKSDVNWCERPENKSIVSNVNLRGTFNVCHAAQVRKLPVVLLSSDHIYGGRWGLYREKDKGNPINFYGFSKFSAESLQKVFDNLKIIRTSYLFDRERLNHQLAKLWDGIPDTYPTFIIRTFMYLPHFAMTLCHYLDWLERMPKVLHLSGNKAGSWYDLMREIAVQSGKDTKLVVPRQSELLNRVPRPYWGGLNVNLSRKLGFKQHSYKEGVTQMMKDWK